MFTVKYKKRFLSGTLKGITISDSVRVSDVDFFTVGRVYTECGTGNLVEITEVEVS